MLNTCDKTKMPFFGIQIPFAYIFIMSRRQILFLSRLLKVNAEAVVKMFDGMDTRLSVEQRVREILIGYFAAKKARKIIENVIVLPEVKMDCMDFMNKEHEKIMLAISEFKNDKKYLEQKALARMINRTNRGPLNPPIIY